MGASRTDPSTHIFTDGSTKKDGSGIAAALGDGRPLFSRAIKRVHHHRVEMAAIPATVNASHVFTKH